MRTVSARAFARAAFVFALVTGTLGIVPATAAAAGPSVHRDQPYVGASGAPRGVPTGPGVSPDRSNARPQLTAGYNWVDGVMNQNAQFLGMTGLPGNDSAYVGYYPYTDADGYPTGDFPQVGDIYYMHVVLAVIGNPSGGGDVPNIQVQLPVGTSLAIDAEHPQQCFAWDGNGKFYDKTGFSFCTTGVGTVLPIYLGYFGIPSYGIYEVQFPVRSTQALNGVTYPDSYLINWNDWAIGEFPSGADQYADQFIWVPDISVDTTITGKPASSTTSTSASFSFTSNAAGAKFYCALDAEDWVACTSPKTYSGLSTGSHTFWVDAQEPSFGHVDPTPAYYTWTITSGTPPSFAFDAAYYAAAEGSGTATIKVKRSGSTSGTNSVVFKTANGSASAGMDYSTVSKTISFAPGEVTKSVSVPILQDTKAEGSETVNLSLSSPSSGTSLGTQKTATLTITDDETTQAFFLSATAYTVNEGAGTLSISVRRSGTTTGTASVYFKTFDGTAKAGSDYSTVAKTVSFAAGETSKTISIPILQDTKAEGYEAFNLALTTPSAGAVIGTQKSAVVTILDDETTPTLFLASVAYTASEGSGSATVTVRRSGTTTGTASVTFATANGSATSGSDYTAVSKSVSFAAGETSKTVSIPIIQDTKVEGAETVSLSLSSPSSGAVLGTQKSGTLTISDDETTPAFYLSATSYSVSEGSGTATITVIRSGSASAAGSVVFKTANGTATAGSDYTAVTKTVSFASGEVAKTVTISITNDTTKESSETISLSLSSPSSGSVLGTQKTATLTIADND